MDDFRALTLAWDTLPSETALPVTISPTTAYLNERRSLRAEGDKALIKQLTSLLSTPSDQELPLPTQPANIAERSQLGQWAEVFSKAINQKDFMAWAETQHIDVQTLRVHNSTLHVNTHLHSKVFTLADTSGWWTVANPIIYISQLVDPTNLGMAYLPPRLSGTTLTLPLNLTLAFHGLPMPVNRLQALTIVEELQALQSFPGFDDNGRSKSMSHAEAAQQLRDYHDLADALQALIADEEALSPFDIYRARLHLKSDSKLARDLKEAATLLKEIIEEMDHGSTDDTPAPDYFDYQRQVLCVLNPDKGHELHTLVPTTPDTRWYRLGLLSEGLGVDIYPDSGLSVVSVMKAYDIKIPLGLEEVRTLIQHLREWPAPEIPVVLNTARSFSELYRYRQYVGLLNDRHIMRAALSRVIDGGTLEGPDGLERFVDADPDTLLATVKSAYAQLRVLTDDPQFQAIRIKEKINPASHVLLSAHNHIGAWGVDGVWKSLTNAVMDNPRLTLLVPTLAQLAAKSGGYLRTNDTVNLIQALRLSRFQVPSTLEQARITLRRLEVSQPLPAGQGHYWRALKPTSSTQPSAWKLSVLERQQILTISETFMQGQVTPLFEHLGQVLVEGKSVADVRAEADFLMVGLLALPLAQQLGEDLAKTVHWHGSHASERTQSGSRNALILAALILSLDPRPEAHPTRLNYLDWHDAYYWGESASFARSQIESSLRGLSAPVAALAAHLILCQKSPQLLVRDIPDSAPCLSSQAWVLFRQYVTYMEKVIPGASRQLTYAQIMSLAYLAPERKWSTFLDSHEATWPILEWAMANGVLIALPRYDTQLLNIAIDALNAQRARLTNTLEAFARPIVTLRQTALNDLRKVYPDSTALEAPILMWLPEHSPFSEEGRFEGIHTGPKYSFVDLHMAGTLGASSNRWHSSDKAVKYRDMAGRFHLLGQINTVFAYAFDKKLDELKAAYGESICYGLSHMTLPRREALEYGRVQFFTLSQVGRPPDRTHEVGRFGVLVCVTYYSDRAFYELFPKQVLIRPRRDLDYEQVMRAVDAGSSVPGMRFDWPAYERGAAPADLALTAAATHLVIGKLDHELPEADKIPPQDLLGRRVPRTFDSPRSHALANIIIEHHLMHDAQALRDKARLPTTLDEAVSGNDPWADYLRSVALVTRGA